MTDLEQFAPVVDLPLDPGIRRAVLVLRSEGVNTLESCEGGPGHPSPEPVVYFDADRAGAERAVAVARAHDLPVLFLRRCFQVLRDGGLAPPCWQLVFCPSMTAQSA